jgi:ribosome biogenesis GTPase A
VLVVNKMDLLPSDTKMAERRLLSWVREQPEYQALPPVAAIHFVSAHTGWGLPRLLGRLCKLCAHHGTNAQFIGLTNAGKSTLVNRLLNTGQRQEVTTSPVAGTTLGNLAFRLICDRRHGGPRLFRKGDAPRKAAGIRTVYDTPGIIDPTHLTQLLTPDEQRAIFPAKCTPKLNTVKREQSLLFGGLARIDYVSGDPAHVVLVSFASPHIKMHKTNAARADALVANAAEGGGEGVRPMVLTPPYSEGRADPFPPLSNVTEHTVMGRGWRSKNAAADLVLPGVGWAMVFAPAGTQVVLRASLVPGHPATVRTPLENG